MKITIAITGASGSIYARLLLSRLIIEDEVETVRVIFTKNGLEVMNFEQGGDTLPYSPKIEYADNDNYYCSVASGSGSDDAMVIVPCSVGMMSRIACGISDNLISRGADVMLKERRRLIIVVRETPFNLIHLQNMVTLTTAGAVIVPASPSFYSKAESIEELCNTTVTVIMRQLGITVKEQWPSRQ